MQPLLGFARSTADESGSRSGNRLPSENSDFTDSDPESQEKQSAEATDNNSAEICANWLFTRIPGSQCQGSVRGSCSPHARPRKKKLPTIPAQGRAAGNPRSAAASQPASAEARPRQQKSKTPSTPAQRLAPSQENKSYRQPPNRAGLPSTPAQLLAP
jgi:hypothetical protein